MLNYNDDAFIYGRYGMFKCENLTNLPSTIAAREAVSVGVTDSMPTLDSKHERRLRIESRALWSGASSFEVMMFLLLW
jgi:hypothetical protein